MMLMIIVVYMVLMDVGYLFDVIVCGGICKNDDRYDIVDLKYKVFFCYNGV